MRPRQYFLPAVLGLAIASVSFSAGLLADQVITDAGPSDWLGFAGAFLGAAFALLGGLAVVEFGHRRGHLAKTNLLLTSLDEPAAACELLARVIVAREALPAHEFMGRIRTISIFYEHCTTLKLAIQADTIPLVRALAALTIDPKLLLELQEQAETLEREAYNRGTFMVDFRILKHESEERWQSLLNIIGAVGTPVVDARDYLTNRR